MFISDKNSGDACHDADLDYDSCMKGGKKTAELYFILYVTRNFHDWIDQIFGSIDSARSHFSSRSTELTTKFTTHDLPEVCWHSPFPEGPSSLTME